MIRTALLPCLWALTCAVLGPMPGAALQAEDTPPAWQRYVLQDGVRERAIMPNTLAAPGTRDPDAARAAKLARERYGGRVLAVAPTRKGYNVRLLLDNGRVITVEIRE